MDAAEMRRRTKSFAKNVIRLCRLLPNSREGWRIGDQLFRSATSVGANYRAACCGRSRADFIAKLGIVLEEADESQFWLELISEMEILDCTLLCELLNESRQLVAMLTASLNTAKDNKPANRS